MSTIEGILIEKYGEPIGYEGGTEVIFKCPKCSHKLRANIIKGLVNCFYCGYGKGIKLEGVESFKFVQKSYDLIAQNKVANYLISNFNLSKVHKDYLISRGIVNPEQYGLRSIPISIVEVLFDVLTEEERRNSGLIDSRNEPAYCVTPNRILIPYFSGKDNLIGFKTRVGPYEENFTEQFVRYTNTPGTQITRFPYYNILSCNNIIITEGELKAIVTEQGGDYNVFSLPGINAHNDCIKRLRKIIKNLYLRISNLQVYLILDREEDHMNHFPILNATVRLCDFLGAIPILLPSPQNTKIGIDDFILVNGYHSLNDLIQERAFKGKQLLDWSRQRVKDLKKCQI